MSSSSMDSLGSESSAESSQGSATGLVRLAQLTSSGLIPVEEIDWVYLRRLATEAAQHAYAPYSRLQVGAAAIASGPEGLRVVVGCNVENASLGLTMCAECALIGQLHLTGGGKLVAIVAVDGAGNILTPCGRCRQLLMEQGGPHLWVQGVNGPRPHAELLPDWFGPEDLPK
jgi:cytidine deaminase